MRAGRSRAHSEQKPNQSDVKTQRSIYCVCLCVCVCVHRSLRLSSLNKERLARENAAECPTLTGCYDDQRLEQVQTNGPAACRRVRSPSRRRTCARSLAGARVYSHGRQRADCHGNTWSHLTCDGPTRRSLSWLRWLWVASTAGPEPSVYSSIISFNKTHSVLNLS